MIVPRTLHEKICPISEKLGPQDSELALRTDPDSVRAVMRRMQFGAYTLTNTRTTEKTGYARKEFGADPMVQFPTPGPIIVVPK